LLGAPQRFDWALAANPRRPVIDIQYEELEVEVDQIVEDIIDDVEMATIAEVNALRDQLAEMKLDFTTNIHSQNLKQDTSHLPAFTATDDAMLWHSWLKKYNNYFQSVNMDEAVKLRSLPRFLDGIALTTFERPHRRCKHNRECSLWHIDGEFERSERLKEIERMQRDQ
jgi:hypothetical protein